MSEEIDKEITTKKVTSNLDPSVNGYKVSEKYTSTATNDNSATGLIIGILLTVAVGAGAVIYYLNSRPTPTIVLPNPTTIIKDNKSTTIERTTVKEAPTQPAPKVEVNIPPQPAPKVEVNIPVTPLAPVTPPVVPSPANN